MCTSGCCLLIIFVSGIRSSTTLDGLKLLTHHILGCIQPLGKRRCRIQLCLLKKYLSLPENSCNNIFRLATVDGSEIRRSPVDTVSISSPFFTRFLTSFQWLLFGMSEPSTSISQLGGFSTRLPFLTIPAV